MITVRLLIILVAAGALSLPTGAADEATEKEHKLLEGIWAVVSFEENGHQVGGGIEETKWAFKGDTLSVVSGEENIEGRYALNVSETPKEMDFYFDKDEPVLSIYQLHGDSLKICYEFRLFGTGVRPKEFKAVENRTIFIFILKRDIS